MEVRCDGCGQVISEDDLRSGRVIRYGGKVFCGSCAEKMWPSTSAEVEVLSDEPSGQPEETSSKRCISCGAEFQGEGVLCPACMAKRPILCSRCGRPVSVEDIQTDKALTTDDGKVFCPACVELVKPLFEAMGGRLPSPEETTDSEEAPTVLPVSERRHIPPEPPGKGPNPAIWLALIFIGLLVVIALASLGGSSGGTSQPAGGFHGSGDSSGTTTTSTGPGPKRPTGGVVTPVGSQTDTEKQRKHLEEMRVKIAQIKRVWTPQRHRSIIRQLDELAFGEELEVEMLVREAKEDLQKRFMRAAEEEFEKARKKALQLHRKEDYIAEIEVLEAVPEWVRDADDYEAQIEEMLEEAKRLDGAKKACRKALDEAGVLMSRGDLEGAKGVLDGALADCEGTRYEEMVAARLREVEKKIEEKKRAEFEAAWRKLQEEVEKALKAARFEEARQKLQEFRSRYGEALRGRKDVEEKLAEYDKRCEAGRVVEEAEAILKEMKEAGGRRASWEQLQPFWFRFLSLKASLFWKHLDEEILAHIERYEKKLTKIITAVHKGWFDVVPFYTFLGMKKSGLTRLGGEYKNYEQPHYRVRFLRPPKAKLVRYIVTYRCDKLPDKEKKRLAPAFHVRVPDIKQAESVWGDFFFESGDKRSARLLEFNTQKDGGYVGCAGFFGGSGPLHLAFDATRIILAEPDGNQLRLKGMFNLLSMLRRGETPLSVQVNTVASAGRGSWITLVLWVRYKGASKLTVNRGRWTSLLKQNDLLYWTFPYPVRMIWAADGTVVANTVRKLGIATWYYNAPFMATLKDYRIRFHVTLVKGRFGVCVRAPHPFKPARHRIVWPRALTPGKSATFEFVFRGRKIYHVVNGRENLLQNEADSDRGTFGFALTEGSEVKIHWCEIKPEP